MVEVDPFVFVIVLVGLLGTIILGAYAAVDDYRCQREGGPW